MNRFWDQSARTYDRDMRFIERAFFGDSRRWVCSQATGEVLEVAVGTGLNLRHYPGDARITGIEASPAMLALARQRAADLGSAAELDHGDAQALSFADGSFDTVVCTLALCCIPDHRAAIGEMHRVLRPGGRLILLDHIAASNRVLLGLERMLERPARKVGEYLTRRPLPIVEATGFTIERSERMRAGVVERLTAIKPAQPSRRPPLREFPTFPIYNTDAGVGVTAATPTPASVPQDDRDRRRRG